MFLRGGRRRARDTAVFSKATCLGLTVVPSTKHLPEANSALSLEFANDWRQFALREPGFHRPAAAQC